MDPLLLPNALATIIQLLGIFRQEHKNAKDLGHQKFVEWLDYHRHEAIKDLICGTAAIQAEVDTLLRADHAVIMAKLDTIDKNLAMLLSRVDGFSGLASAIVPSASLSDQALHILRQALTSASGRFIFGDFGQGRIVFQPEEGDPFSYHDPRFLAEDLDTLVALGLLSIETIGSDVRTYRITRATSPFIEPASPAAGH